MKGLRKDAHKAAQGPSTHFSNDDPSVINVRSFHGIKRFWIFGTLNTNDGGAAVDSYYSRDLSSRKEKKDVFIFHLMNK